MLVGLLLEHIDIMFIMVPFATWMMNPCDCSHCRLPGIPLFFCFVSGATGAYVSQSIRCNVIVLSHPRNPLSLRIANTRTNLNEVTAAIPERVLAKINSSLDPIETSRTPCPKLRVAYFLRLRAPPVTPHYIMPCQLTSPSVCTLVQLPCQCTLHCIGWEHGLVNQKRHYLWGGATRRCACAMSSRKR